MSALDELLAELEELCDPYELADNDSTYEEFIEELRKLIEANDFEEVTAYYER